MADLYLGLKNLQKVLNTVDAKPKLLLFVSGTHILRSLHYGLSPIEKGDIKNFKFKTLLHIQLFKPFLNDDAKLTKVDY